MNKVVEIDGRPIGKKYPVYFIADIAANHDGDLERAKDLIYLAAQSGADAAKFQHFKAETIVSDKGFKSLERVKSHQSRWVKSVYQVYEEASINLDWTETLKSTCEKAGISFFSSPYSLELVHHLDPFVPAYKIGSGDITWTEIIETIAEKRKPVILASGASTLQDIDTAMKIIAKSTDEIVLMQCNTNYTGSEENFNFINLNVLKEFKRLYPQAILGLSDHTKGDITVLGAIALGAKVVEKHFTDDVVRQGPDHAFSMDPNSWKEMVERSRLMEKALGRQEKEIEENEKETVVLQRRCLRSASDLNKGTKLKKSDLIVLRPCPDDALPPNKLQEIVGMELQADVKKGSHLTWNHLK